MMIFESVLLTVLGILVGLALVAVSLFVAKPFLESQLGLSVNLFDFSVIDLFYIGLFMAGAIFVGLVPAWRAYRNTLTDGLTVRT